jgi:hypothetical protein
MKYIFNWSDGAGGDFLMGIILLLKYPQEQHWVEGNKINNLWQTASERVTRAVKYGYLESDKQLELLHSMPNGNTLQTHVIDHSVAAQADRVVNIVSHDIQTRCYLKTVHRCKTVGNVLDTVHDIHPDIPGALNICYEDLFFGERRQELVTKLLNLYEVYEFDYELISSCMDHYTIKNNKLIQDIFLDKDELKGNEDYCDFIRSLEDMEEFLKFDHQGLYKDYLKNGNPGWLNHNWRTPIEPTNN